MQYRSQFIKGARIMFVENSLGYFEAGEYGTIDNPHAIADGMYWVRCGKDAPFLAWPREFQFKPEETR